MRDGPEEMEVGEDDERGEEDTDTPDHRGFGNGNEGT